MNRKIHLRYSGKKKYATIIWKTLMRSVFFSTKRLLSYTAAFFDFKPNEKNKLVCITPSGRTALNQVFSLPDIQTILLPEYICNVVPMAASEKKVQYYPVYPDYQFEIKEILCAISVLPNCCVLISSYLNRTINIEETIRQIRKISLSCIIVLDECQNMQSAMELPELDDRTYVVYSFNNKMTYGFLGGAIIQGKTNHTVFRKFSPATFTDNLHGFLTVLLSGIKDLTYAISGHFPYPTDPDESQGKGIYGVKYERLLKVSLAASSLAKEYLKWYMECLNNNHLIAEKMHNQGIITMVFNDGYSLMPYIPVHNPKQLYGILPFKGRYGGLNREIEERNICLMLHNAMKMEIINK